MKKKLKTFCFDLDNTLCDTKGSKYHKSKPKKRTIEIVNSLYDKGYIIKIYTARYMGRTDDKLINKKIVYNQTVRQLRKFGIKYHKLFISKPSADIYIDDKGYGYDSSWTKKFKSYKKVK